ncbi:glucose/galactose transporter [Emticicia oligotrophica DSM 17448]|uniref:Glucose/galactose transporter n=1 Tax=Emticicia oligotrophica (strain DSM 17448 / CIP 109782 / MTCC 6937 / GPTSA100-15) TaxID=929562 RepID=A0ABN4AU73_EMTOG|nr:sugar MFS transporter [Emticicia oligotrophica]AFK05247.1 glucose/galactose transporter [Emticicia oligotrophica DSM 17448]
MQENKNYTGPLIIIGLLFFVFGFVTWVNGTLISFFKSAFGLSNANSYLVTFAFFISYTVMAIPSSFVLKKVGFKKGMSVGLAIMAVGTFIFIPAAKSESYPLFLVGLFTIGIGLTLLQTASNPYATILGPRESAAQRISILGIANKTAGIISQKIFGGILLAGSVAGAALSSKEQLAKVITPYLILTAVLVALSVLILLTKGLPEVSEEQESNEENSSNTTKTSVFEFPNLVLGLIALFCYVGVEVIAGDTIISYGISLGFSSEEASQFGTYTLWCMMIGYILGIVLIPKFVSQQTWLKLSSIFGIIITIFALVTSGFTSVLCIAILGLANAIMWPAIWPLAIDGLGKFTKTGSAWLIMMIAGGAILPLVYGTMVDYLHSAQNAYAVLIPLYAFVLYFAMLGYKKKSW